VQDMSFYESDYAGRSAMVVKNFHLIFFEHQGSEMNKTDYSALDFECPAKAHVLDTLGFDHKL
jgi:hypothetical protein